MLISQEDAAEMFDVPTLLLFVCDGKKDCGKPSCRDFSDKESCHHTSDPSHALYGDHDTGSFERHSAIRGEHAVTICVEPIRG